MGAKAKLAENRRTVHALPVSDVSGCGTERSDASSQRASRRGRRRLRNGALAFFSEGVRHRWPAKSGDGAQCSGTLAGLGGASDTLFDLESGKKSCPLGLLKLRI